MKRIRLFVYGTLKRGGALHRHMEDFGKFIGNNSLKGFKMVNIGWFPAIYETGNEEDVVHGETYEIDEDNLKVFDAVEGYPSLYNRKETEHGIVYFMENKNNELAKYRPIKDGNFNVTH